MQSNENREEKISDEVIENNDILYGVNDNPPWYLCILFAFQHCFLSIGGSVGPPLALASALCISDDDTGNLAKTYLVASVLVVNGISSILQASLGTRLPILQGSSFAFLVPAFSIMKLSHNICPSRLNITRNGLWLYNETRNGEFLDENQIWMRRVAELQGAMIVASLFEILIGATGIIGFLTKLFGPITICTTISLIGIQLVSVAPMHAHYNWGIAFFTAFVLVVSSQYMKNLKFPILTFSREKKCHVSSFELFKLFPVFIAIILGWILSLILTSAGVFSDDPKDDSYFARSDAKISSVNKSPWFRCPYPGQWGLPVITVAGAVGMLSAICASIIESIGDYNACATMARAPQLPKHAVNRGIMMEGFGCLLAGVVGTTTGTTSYSENVAAIGITRVGSRRVIQVAGIVSILLGCITKFGAFVVSIPDPVFGGIFMVVFGMIIAIGLTNLRYVDLTSSRNIFVIGFSFYIGLMVPQAIEKNLIKINTGIQDLDNTIFVLLSSSLTVGAVVAAVIDNTLPGTNEEKGVGKTFGKIKNNPPKRALQEKCYNPICKDPCGLGRYLPFLPTPASSSDTLGENAAATNTAFEEDTNQTQTNL